jgi:malate dehydrogenase (oxaloacetate-decarboxylating)(NADP+)
MRMPLVRCDIDFVWYHCCAARRISERQAPNKNRNSLFWGNVLSKPDRMTARSAPYSPSPRGLALLRDPLLNKGTAFTDEERDALGLRGFLPATVLSMQAQVERILTNLRGLPSDLEKYIALNALHDRS